MMSTSFNNKHFVDMYCCMLNVSKYNIPRKNFNLGFSFEFFSPILHAKHGY